MNEYLFGRFARLIKTPTQMESHEIVKWFLTLLHRKYDEERARVNESEPGWSWGRSLAMFRRVSGVTSLQLASFNSSNEALMRGVANRSLIS